MDRLEPRGDAPGWVYKHRAAAVVDGPRGIRVWGGTVVTDGDGGESHDQNPGSFVLDLDRLQWDRERGT